MVKKIWNKIKNRKKDSELEQHIKITSDDVAIIISKNELPKIIIPSFENDEIEAPEHIVYAVAIGVLIKDEEFKRFVMDKWDSIIEDNEINEIHYYYGCDDCNMIFEKDNHNEDHPNCPICGNTNTFKSIPREGGVGFDRS